MAAEFRRNPVMLYSIGKEELVSVMLHLALKAFYPAKPPFPLLHVDTTWKFLRDDPVPRREVKRLGLDLVGAYQRGGVKVGINPFDSGAVLHTQVMKTKALKQALDKHGFDAAVGGARRDEEKSRAKERDVFVPQRQRMRGIRRTSARRALGVYNTRLRRAVDMRVFPLSNWTELDVWTYIHLEGRPPC